MADPIDLLDRTVRTNATHVATVTPAALGRPTPCTEWTVRELLNHMIGTAQMFAAAAAAEPPARPLSGEPVDLAGDQPQRAYEQATAQMVAAWRRRGLDGTLTLGPFQDRPAAELCTVALCDQLAHGWDLAQATGGTYSIDEDVLDAAWTFGQANLTPERRGPGMPFAAAVEPPAGASRLERLMAFYGRHPLTR